MFDGQMNARMQPRVRAGGTHVAAYCNSPMLGHRRPLLLAAVCACVRAKRTAAAAAVVCTTHAHETKQSDPTEAAWNLGVFSTCLRNPNLQIRSEPTVPVFRISIWNMSPEVEYQIGNDLSIISPWD